MAPVPVNWFLGAVLLAVCCVIGGALVAFIVGHRTYRKLRWPSERSRRLKLERAVANVERCDRITEGGYCDVVISFAPRAPSNYRASEARRLRATVLLSGDAIEEACERKTLAIRFDPDSMTRVFIDHDAVLAERAERAEAFERGEYIDRGLPRWKMA